MKWELEDHTYTLMTTKDIFKLLYASCLTKLSYNAPFTLELASSGKGWLSSDLAHFH